MEICTYVVKIFLKIKIIKIKDSGSLWGGGRSPKGGEEVLCVIVIDKAHEIFENKYMG